ncbi:MAG: BatA domain-containing protein [Planctomycetaceae bacterium]|nr:BatA domain-containing protein [Planctomycetaceae bacterium]
MLRISILAFGFLNPFLLWGLFFAGIPLLIQWLHRRKYVERVWAAMRFLKAATESQTRRLRMESLLLLCIRTAILILAALAVAQPILESSGLLAPDETATHTLIVFDTSLSMQARTDGETVAEQARERVRNIVKAGKVGDSYQLLTIAARPRAIIRQPSFSSVDVLMEIDRLEMTESFGDVPASLDEALRLLKQSQTQGKSRTVIISDFQRTNWELDDPASRERAQRVLDELAGQSTIELVLLTTGVITNTSVLNAEAETGLVTVGTPVSISAQIRNHGRETLRQQRIQLLENDRVLQTEMVDLPANGETGVSFVTQWAEAGHHALQIRAEEDALPADNSRWLTVDVKSELAVLLVNGRPGSEPLQGATDFLELALQPLLTADTNALSRMRSSWDLRPTVINEADLVRTELAEYDCVFLCDVAFLSDDEVSRLETYVRGGGGLVIGMGNQVQLDDYNRRLSRDGQGLMPVQLVRVVGESDDETEPFHFTEPVAGSPITQPFVGNLQSGLTTANIYRYVETRTPEDSGARVVLSYQDGAPAILEHTYGSGRVLLFTTSLDDQWGSWALWPSFLPMMHETVEYVASGPKAREAIVDQPLSIELSAQDGFGQSLTLRQPDGRTRPLHGVVEEHSLRVTIDDLRQSGVYALEVTPDDTQLFAVNLDPRESHLRCFADTELSTTVLGSVGFDVLGAAGRTETTDNMTRTTTGFSRWLLVAVLTLLFIEQLMAWNGRYGLVGLLACPLVIAGASLLPVGFASLLAVALVWVIIRRWRFQKKP